MTERFTNFIIQHRGWVRTAGPRLRTEHTNMVHKSRNLTIFLVDTSRLILQHRSPFYFFIDILQNLRKIREIKYSSRLQTQVQPNHTWRKRKCRRHDDLNSLLTRQKK